MWNPIETLPAEMPKDGIILLWGAQYAYDDTPEQRAKEDPSISILDYSYVEKGKRIFASTDRYYDTEIYYSDATLWAFVPYPGSGPTTLIFTDGYATLPPA